MDKFYATIEFLGGQSAAILTLTDASGDWAGSGRVEGRTRSDIYERAYTLASLNAQSKGGRLERFSVVECPKDTTKGLHEIPESPDGAVQALAGDWKERRLTCGASVTPAFQHRPGNTLNVEPIQPWTRCLDKKPESWPEGSSALRWMASGGEAWVFGPCSARCPRESR